MPLKVFIIGVCSGRTMTERPGLNSLPAYARDKDKLAVGRLIVERTKDGIAAHHARSKRLWRARMLAP